MKKVLLTGARGFVGAHLRRFLTQKQYQVFSAVHKKNARDSKDFLELDITDRSLVFQVIRKLKPRYICHLAALSIPRISWGAREKTFAINVSGTLHLLEAVRRYSPKTRILFMSSAQVYGRHFRRRKAIREQCPPWPENPYAFSKAVAELACFEFSRRFGVDTVAVRALNIVGTGARADLAFSEWCAQIVRAESKKQSGEVSVGDLSLRRDFLHIDDAVRALELLLRRGKSGEVYNLASGKPLPLAGYMKFLIKKAKVKIKTRPQRSLFRKNDPRTVRVNVHKIRSLGWSPRKSAFSALEELLDDYRKKAR